MTTTLMGVIQPECVRTNLAGFAYDEISCLYPRWGKSFWDWELQYDPVSLRDKMVSHPAIPIMAILLYGVGITLGRSYFASRSPWSWRRTLAMWNLLLSLFSAVGFVRTAVQLGHNLTHYNLRDNVCRDPESAFGSGSTGLWVQLFILSKFPELLDTFFIVIHKKPLIFLHWYHHVTVLLYCWHAYVTKAPSGLFFVVMNYGVHSVMYGYYFLMAVKLKPKWMNAMIVTVAQISQMVVGVAVTLFGMYHSSDEDCWIHPENNMAAMLMYGSYLLLFLNFFWDRYFQVTTTRTRKHRSKLE